MGRVSAVLAGHALVGDRLVRDALLEIDDRGRIGSVGPRSSSLPPGTLDLSGRVVIPGAANAHSHAFQVLLRGRCERADSFRQWVSDYLYPLVQVITEEDVRAASRLAFAEMAACGVTTVGEFHYLHRGPGGADVGNALADAVIEAALEVGLRIRLLRAFYDEPGPAGRERFVEPPELSARRTSELRAAWIGDERVSIAAAPHSLHGASIGAFRSARAWSEEHDTPLHVHLAEQQGDVAFALDKHGETPLRALDRHGLVDARTIVVHGCWLDGEEMDLLGRRGGGLVCCPGSNAALGDGVTDLGRAVAAGVRVGLGADGACANNQVDLLREMRMAEHLQRIEHLRMGVLTGEHGGRALVDMGTRGGMSCLGLEGGAIAEGQLADLVALDPDDLSLQPLDLDGDPTAAADLLCSQVAFAASIRGALTDSLVGGRPILRDRRLLHVDPTEVARRVRAAPALRLGNR